MKGPHQHEQLNLYATLDIKDKGVEHFSWKIKASFKSRIIYINVYIKFSSYQNTKFFRKLAWRISKIRQAESKKEIFFCFLTDIFSASLPIQVYC